MGKEERVDNNGEREGERGRKRERERVSENILIRHVWMQWIRSIDARGNVDRDGAKRERIRPGAQ